MYTREQIQAEKQRRANLRVQSVNQQEQQMQQPIEMPQAQYQENPFMSGVVGFNTAIERPVQGLMQLITGDKWKGLQDTARKREAKYERSAAVNPGSTFAGDILGNLGLGAATGGGFSSLAGKMVPVAKSVPYLQNILGGILGGGAFGGAQYVEPNESRLANTLEGAGIGGGLSAVIPGIGRAIPMAGKGISRLVGNQSRIMKDFLSKFSNEEMSTALKNKSVADRLGVKLTPAEAGDNPIAAAKEAKAGYTDEGQRNLLEYDKLKKKLDEESIKKLLKGINPKSENANEEIRNSAKKIIKDREKALQSKAKPYYEASKLQEIEPSKLKELTNNGIIEKELKAVITDPMYRTEVEGVNVNSIKVLDEVKKRIDGLIGRADRAGDKNEVRLLKKAKEQLVSAMDDVSGDYAKARAIYSEESPLIDLLRKRDIGKIAKLKDSQTKNIGNIIFDSKQTDNRELARLASEFNKENPEAWSRIVRNYIENSIDTKYKGKTGYHGTNFFNQFLSQDKSYDKLMTALSGNHEAQQTLKDMRQVFKLIQNKPTAKGAAARSASNVDVNRNWLAEVNKFLHKATGGHYDKAMIDIITTDKWQKAFETALKNPTAEAKGKGFINLLDDVMALSGKASALKKTATKGPFREEENNED